MIKNQNIFIYRKIDRYTLKEVINFSKKNKHGNKQDLSILIVNTMYSFFKNKEEEMFNIILQVIIKKNNKHIHNSLSLNITQIFTENIPNN